MSTAEEAEQKLQLDEEAQKVQLSQIEQEDQKDRMVIYEALGRMRKRGVTDTKKFTWKLVWNENKNEYENNENDEKDGKNNTNDKEKQQQPQKEERLSQLININKKEMCSHGHAGKLTWEDSEHKCIICGYKKEIKYCEDCCILAENKGMDTNESDYSYCYNCRISNGKSFKERIQLANYKAAIIRKELLKNPDLERDLICDMPRRKAVQWLVEDINKLASDIRCQWCLLVMDLDYLKAWNSCLGHGKTDELIKQIGGIMQSNINDINQGKWGDIKDTYDKIANKSLSRGFCYRTGDEFVIAIKCGSIDYGAPSCPLGVFYNKMKREINALGDGIKYLLFSNSTEWKEVKEKLNNATDRNGNRINMNIVGISTGIYMSSASPKGSNWLEIADKIALEHAKQIYKPKKNGVSIYWEHIGGLIDDEKVGKCMSVGVYNGYYK